MTKFDFDWKLADVLCRWMFKIFLQSPVKWLEKISNRGRRPDESIKHSPTEPHVGELGVTK